MNYQSVTSFFPLKKSQFSSRGLGLHNLHAGFNCLAFQSLGATNRRSAFFIPNVLPENEPRKKTLGNSPIFRPEETHQKKHMQHDISKRKHKRMGKHIDLGEGPRQQKTTLSGRDSLLALLNGIFVWSLLNGISEKNHWHLADAKGLQKKNVIKTKCLFSLVVSTHLKNSSQIGSSPQIGVKIKHI